MPLPQEHHSNLLLNFTYSMGGHRAICPYFHNPFLTPLIVWVVTELYASISRILGSTVAYLPLPPFAPPFFVPGVRKLFQHI